MNSRRIRITALATTAVAGAVCSLALALAQPSPPTFAYLYGQVLVGGQNISPQTQPVIAFVNGKSCTGTPTTTFVATEGDDIPEEDVGRTVYVIDVLADGSALYERPGCGQAGDPIIFWFPEIGRMPSTRPLFQPGPTRADLELDVHLAYRGVVPELASEGAD